MLAPFLGNQVVVDGALAGIVDEIVDDGAVYAALEQRVALVVVRIEVAEDQDVGDVVVNQRALGMLAFGVRRIREALRR